MLSGEHVSGPHLGSQLSLCPGGTNTPPADRACDRFVICTRYARYFASPSTCSAHPSDGAPPYRTKHYNTKKTCYYCRIAPNHALVSRNALLPPPPTKKTSSGVAVSPPKALASPPKASASPPKLESDDV